MPQAYPFYERPCEKCIFCNQILRNITIHVFFISNAKLKLAKDQANAKRHPEAEL